MTSYIKYSMFTKHLNPKKLNHLHDAVYKKHLGEGGFGQVQLYQCREKCNNFYCNKCFVVKTMKKYVPGFSKNQDILIDHFYKEYSTGILLHHPNIRETLDIDTKSHSIIFEYCPGIDLLDFLNQYDNDTKLILPLFSQILDAIEYLHKNGVAHLDLKLENIIIHDNIIKIIDLGEAVVYKINNKEHLHQGLNGTLQYMPPEMLERKLYRPDKIDIWSCGIILYNMVYNYMPWEEADIKKDKNYNIFNKTFDTTGELHHLIFKTLPDNYSITEKKVLKTLFKTMFNKNPDSRKSISMIKKIFNLINWVNTKTIQNTYKSKQKLIKSFSSM